jgi:hypothetical protein
LQILSGGQGKSAAKHLVKNPFIMLAAMTPVAFKWSPKKQDFR